MLSISLFMLKQKIISRSYKNILHIMFYQINNKIIQAYQRTQSKVIIIASKFGFIEYFLIVTYFVQMMVF